MKFNNENKDGSSPNVFLFGNWYEIYDPVLNFIGD